MNPGCLTPKPLPQSLRSVDGLTVFCLEGLNKMLVSPLRLGPVVRGREKEKLKSESPPTFPRGAQGLDSFSA